MLNVGGSLTATANASAPTIKETLNLGRGSVGTTLSASSGGGDITQEAIPSGLTVGFGATISAGAGNITLTETGNDFGLGTVSLIGANVNLRDTNALIATATATGTLTLHAGGALSTASGGLSGVNVNLTGSTGISLGHAVTATDTLNLTAGSGTIGQNVGGVITAGGVTTIDAGTGDISLLLSTNDFQSTVHLAGNAAHIVDKNGLTLGTLNLGGNLTATANAGGLTTETLNLGTGDIGGVLNAGSANGDITQASGGLTVGFGATINAGTGNITLLQANDSIVGPSTVSLTGANVSLVDTNALIATATATGTLTLLAGGLLSTATGGLAGTNVTLAGDAGINLGHAVAASGTLNLTSNNATIGQGAGGVISASGVATVNAGTGEISFLLSTNDFQSPVALSGGAISVVDTNNLSVSALVRSTNEMLILSAGGQLTLPSQDIDTGTAILQLRSQGGTLATPGNLSGGNVTLVGRDGLTLAHDVTAGGFLILGATDNAINQTAGSIGVTGTTFASAGTGTIALSRTTNDFGGAVTLNSSGSSVSIRDVNDLALAAPTLGANTGITAIAGGTLTLPAATAFSTGTGNIDFQSNGGTLATTGNLTTTSGTISLTGSAGSLCPMLSLQVRPT